MSNTRLYRYVSVTALAVLAAMLSASIAMASGSGAYQAPTRAPQASDGPVTRSTAVNNLIKNGGFETGDFTNWTKSDLPEPYIPWTVLSTASPEGTHLARNGFDGGGPGSYDLYQVVKIPAEGSWVLSWSDASSWNMTVGTPPQQPRSQYVEVRKPSGQVLETVYSFSTPTGPTAGSMPWTVRSVDLSDFAGEKVAIAFRQYVPQYFTGPAEFNLDDVRLTTTHLKMKAPSKVADGKKAKITGKLRFDDTACAPSQTLKVKAGNKKLSVMTDGTGEYAFKVKIKKTTKVKASYAGAGVCAPAQVAKTIEVKG